MKGIVYGIGVGPGDGELLTLKAVRLIRQCDVIAVPGKTAASSVAYRIAAEAVPEMAEKDILCLDMPMTKDWTVMAQTHQAAARRIREVLRQGRNVAYLTLGDPSVYSTFSYVRHWLERESCTVEVVPGIPSFCAAAARLGQPLAEWDEPLHIIPAAHQTEDDLTGSGTYILMKSANHLPEVKDRLRRSGRDVSAVVNCGMAGENVYRGVDAIPDDAGYFALIVAKERRGWDAE